MSANPVFSEMGISKATFLKSRDLSGSSTREKPDSSQQLASQILFDLPQNYPTFAWARNFQSVNLTPTR